MYVKRKTLKSFLTLSSYLRQNPSLEPFNARWSKEKANTPKGRQTRRSASSASTSAAAAAAVSDDSEEDVDIPPDELPAADFFAQDDDIEDIVEPELVFVEDNEEEIVFHLNLQSDCEQVRGEKSKRESKGVQVDVGITSELKDLRRENLQLKIQLSLHSADSRSGPRQFEYLTNTEEKFQFYIGLKREQFETVFQFLEPDIYSMKMWDPVPEKRKHVQPRKHDLKFQLGLTLLRLRRGYSLTDLAYQFRMSKNQVGNIFITFIQLLYMKFGEMKAQMFVPQSYHEPVPPAFRNPLLSKVRIVIDCTEFPIESSKDYKQQGNLYSSYKNCTTAKVLTGVAPCGALMYASEAFEGSISDRDIITRSDFLDYIGPGDVVCADKGFTIHDLLGEKGATLVIPPFRQSGQDELNPQQLMLTKIIARARIHIERNNERIKNFQLLGHKIPSHLIPLLSQIVFVVGCLVNFQEPLCI